MVKHLLIEKAGERSSAFLFLTASEINMFIDNTGMPETLESLNGYSSAQNRATRNTVFTAHDTAQY
jgi:hypothetical protein